MPDHTSTQQENQNQLYHTLTFSQILHQSNRLDVKKKSLRLSLTHTTHTPTACVLYPLIHLENGFIGFLKV